MSSMAAFFAGVVASDGAADDPAFGFVGFSLPQAASKVDADKKITIFFIGFFTSFF